MKTHFLKILVLVAAGVTTLACSKKDDSPAPVAPLPQSVAFEKANTTATDIPDQTLAGGIANGTVEIPINIDYVGIIADGAKVYVELDLTHTYPNQLAVELISPAGNTCGLIKRINEPVNGLGRFIAGNKLVFNSTYTTAIPSVDSGTNIPAGNYKPTFGTNTLPTNVVEVPMATFFAGQSINGVWKIKVYDCYYIGVGLINGWKLKFDTGALQ